MGTICLNCGDEGFSNAFVYCVKCLNTAIHRYCLDKLPHPLNEFVRWVCDDCEEKVPNQSTLHKPSSIPSWESEQNSPRKGQAMHKGTKTRKRDTTCLETGKEEHKCDDGSTQQSCVVNRQHNILTKDVLVVPVSEETKSIPLCTTNQEEVVELDSGTDSDENVPRSATAPNNKYDYHGAQPVIDPIWRGSFSIRNEKYDTVDGFVAHLSTQSCQNAQVCEAASSLPSLLCLEMHPKSHVWPKTFQKMEPTDFHIALFFFPADKRYERVFDHMVEDLMCHELGMRASLGNAELLIFTSIELPLFHWRIQGKYYLWGVFKGKQASSLPHTMGQDMSIVANVRNGCAQNNMATRKQRDFINKKITKAQSPLGPLSNKGEHELDVDQESEG